MMSTTKRSARKCSTSIASKIRKKLDSSDVHSDSKTKKIIPKGNEKQSIKLSNDPNTSQVKQIKESTIYSATKAFDYTFYNRPCEELARALLGKKLVRLSDKGERLCGTIVETEAYLGHPDKGAHSYKGKTNKNEAMFMEPGTAYVYHIHSYCCMNISSKGDGAAVLLRALEPVENIPSMIKLRQKRTPGKTFKSHELCNGPSKLCLSLDVSKDQINKEDMIKSTKIWMENGDEIKPDRIVHCKRINISYAEEWVDKPLRYYIQGNKCVSKLDKEAEKAM
ncbi:uncharacterized protein LOC143045830 [Mytilus galloprovincialis]|uniref:uncharacterized protein LOC143045830 n=1 Tax=Mytilus galloprovincialis TaxID=29158 RepID=UPI003F7C3CEF